MDPISKEAEAAVERLALAGYGIATSLGVDQYVRELFRVEEAMALCVSRREFQELMAMGSDICSVLAVYSARQLEANLVF